jgi:hypothetical protein
MGANNMLGFRNTALSEIQNTALSIKRNTAYSFRLTAYSLQLVLKYVCDWIMPDIDRHEGNCKKKIREEETIQVSLS